MTSGATRDMGWPLDRSPAPVVVGLTGGGWAGLRPESGRPHPRAAPRPARTLGPSV